MNIVVCIKQVPDAKTVRFDTEKGTLVREGVEAVINPFDFHALEAGLKIPAGNTAALPSGGNGGGSIVEFRAECSIRRN